MDKKQIEALQAIIEKQDEAIRILSYRTDMILNMLSALTAALGGTKTNVYREVVIQQIDKFEKNIPCINAHLAEHASLELSKPKITSLMIHSSACRYRPGGGTFSE
ncbi:hypothetical protein [Salmonella enterica]|uniref:hypothetical protein n=1 Tax=Salmonella enterica TaxID=28901 RepID=UPI001EFDD682|nr:hypothetical protein [Salmonella enterica]